MRHKNLPQLLIILFWGIIIAFNGIPTAGAEASNNDISGLKSHERPKFNFLRYKEDWSVLKDFSLLERSDFWDPIKHIPLSGDSSFWTSLGGHMRLRLENWGNFAFGAPANNDDSFLLWRTTAHTDVHLGNNIRLFIEGKSALADGRDLPGGSRTIDVDSIALQQAFIDLRYSFSSKAAFTIRPGRQELSFGKSRLVSPLPWGNTLRAWDGVTGILEIDNWVMTGFWTQFVPVQKYDFNESDSGNEFSGIYSTGRIEPGNVGVDIYWLGLDRDSATFNGTSGKEKRHTLGSRLFGKIPNTHFDYDVEGAYQFGEIGSADINAFMIGSQFGYSLSNLYGKPRFFLGFDYGSGDDSVGGDVGTFNQLFPLGHAHLGFIDIIGRQNIIDFSKGVSIKPTRKTNVSLNGHLFRRADDTDALYNAGGGVVRAGAAGSSKDIGYQVDLISKYKYSRHFVAVLGFSHLFAGDFIKESGANDDIDFAYLQLQYTF